MLVDLKEFDAREGWILEIRIDQQGVTEVSPLLVQPLMLRILSSACSQGFLRIMDITQESSSSRKGALPQTEWLWVCDRNMGEKVGVR